MEILLLHPGGLGDIILSLPAVVLLRGRFQSAKLTFAGNIDHISPIISGYAERVVSLSALPLHRLYASEALPPEDVRFWRSFDLIVSWTGSGNSEFIRKTREIHPHSRIAAWKPLPGESRHVSQLFIDSLGFEVCYQKEVTPAYIRLDSATVGLGSRWLAECGWNAREFLAAVHPGAGSVQKRWPLERFIRLARQLVLHEKRKLLIIEGPAESGLAKQMEGRLPAGKTILAESVPLNLLAAALRQCNAFFGNDSGIAHLAAALKVPSVVLFGPTLPQHWAPLGPHVAVIRDTRNCMGCTAGRKTHTCLDNISVEEVIRNSGL